MLRISRRHFSETITMMFRYYFHNIVAILCLAGLALTSHFASAVSNTEHRADARISWIENMKSAPRGPFRRIRWFCNDGTIHPPKQYACSERGGGVQHGEWSQDTLQLRADGYYIANVYADIDDDLRMKIAAGTPVLAQMLIEQFLINSDDGWILRKARYYRGAFQDEDERAGARELLESLSSKRDWYGYRYLLLRAAARFLDHGADNASVQEIRQLSASLSDENAAFKTLRAKIHGRPEASDAAAVRKFISTLPAEYDAAPYQRLAHLIDEVYSDNLDNFFKQLSKSKFPAEIATSITAARDAMAAATTPLAQLRSSAAALANLRDDLAGTDSGKQRLKLLDLSLRIESKFFTAASALEPQLATLSRREHLSLLSSTINALYGSGLISERQRVSALGELSELSDNEVTAASYKRTLDYLSLLPSWGTQNLRLFFAPAINKLAMIEPKANLFIQDFLRGSPMFVYAELIDGLVRDANQLIGVSNVLFGENVGAGLRSLNPGIASGKLYLASGQTAVTLDKRGIYLLPETVSELPPVAGILTEGEGNPLSHVQLLARNLGIPNVGVDQSLLPKLIRQENNTVVLAVSPAGSVRLTHADDPWAANYLHSQQAPEKKLITVDLQKLNLNNKAFVTLSELRASDSGKTVGPKAAKLGELKHFYPEAVAEGLAIPFGVFRDLLENTPHRSGSSLFDWMVKNYQILASLPDEEKPAHTESFRAELEASIAEADPGEVFKSRLRKKLREVFGEDGTYGVFVRSDTNVEDLPGFTGAGLNLTVPNVVGVDNIIQAISRVWASPFTARSFAWRQSLMDKPEHVYPAVLLMLSVNADKSGVLVTQDIDTGSADWLSVAINEGVGGAVDGQSAESVRINLRTGETRLMAAATAPIRRQVNLQGGVVKLPVSTNERVLTQTDIKKLIVFAKQLPSRFPAIVNADGEPAPADIEFGFLNDKLRLFQIRPFLDSDAAQGDTLLLSLDKPLASNGAKLIDLQQPLHSVNR